MKIANLFKQGEKWCCQLTSNLTLYAFGNCPANAVNNLNQRIADHGGHEILPIPYEGRH